MAKKAYEEENIRAIAEKIREKTGTTKTYTTEEMPQGIEEVYSAGSSGGGYEEGFEDGKQAEYDVFWDAYQDNGNRTHYDQAFSGYGWNKETFNPKYDIKPVTAYMLFRQSTFEGDLVEHLKDLGVSLDFSDTTNHLYLFNYASTITHIGIIDARKSQSGSTFDSCFYGCRKLVTIDKLIFNKSTRTSEFSANSFNGCSSLENLTLEGEITTNGLNLQWSTNLSKASIESVISCLSTTTSGLSVTFSRTAVDNAFEEVEGKGDGSWTTEWSNLVATKPNWTISLV